MMTDWNMENEGVEPDLLDSEYDTANAEFVLWFHSFYGSGNAYLWGSI